MKIKGSEMHCAILHTLLVIAYNMHIPVHLFIFVVPEVYIWPLIEKHMTLS